ncbi:MAG: N-acetyltransferase [Planctomycetota bacterium]|nr:N-acetyltransferase [Planctomycetota bacterium]
MEALTRKALLSDVSALVNLTREFGQEGIMIPLSLGDASERIREFSVVEVDSGRLVGCVAVHPTWDLLMEIRSLAVIRSEQGKNHGRRLMEAALADAVAIGAEELFTLTYIPDFFRRFGFQPVDRNSLPHKVWLDCVKCPKFPDCGEVAMKRRL